MATPCELTHDLDFGFQGEILRITVSEESL